MDEDASVATVAGVGPKVAERLRVLGIESVGDLLEHVPRDYNDWEEAASFGDLPAGEEATVRCTLERIRVRRTRRRNLRIVEGTVVDRAGVRETAIWFNQDYLAKLAPDTELLLHGTRDASGGFRVLRHEIGGTGLHTVGLVAEYPATEAIPSHRLRALVEAALPVARFFQDPLPVELRAEEDLPLRSDALAAIHRPERRRDAARARERLALEELVTLQVGLLRRRRALERIATLDDRSRLDPSAADPCVDPAAPELEPVRERFFALGEHQEPWGTGFNMTVFALRTSGHRNGVSQLHGQVSSAMWRKWSSLRGGRSPGYSSRALTVNPGGTKCRRSARARSKVFM